MKVIKVLLKIIKILAWVCFTGFLTVLYIAFCTGFLDAVGDADVPNILGIPPFVGLFAVVHYLVLLLLNRLFYRDEFFGFGLFSFFKEKGLQTTLIVVIPSILLGVGSALVAIIVHLYTTILVFGIISPKKKNRYIPYTPTAKKNTPSNTDNKPSETSKKFNFDSYKNYISSNLNASDIYVNCGHSTFVRDAKVTSLNVTVSNGSTPSVSVSATVTVYVNHSAVNSYIGVDSHHNSTYANSNVTDYEIKESERDAKESAENAISSKIQALTRNFATANDSGPDSVDDKVSVSVRRA